ncbi:MAG: NIPSNAP family protein [Kofleriaceae bacterium]
MPTDADFPIVELRQYTLHPDQRDVLIELFDREFLETQEATGMRVFGQFRDLDRPDRFVWFRGFPDMAARAAALHAFYTGPIWQAHRAAANATMIDSSNVLLLHRATATSGFAETAPRAQPGASATPASLFVATIYAIAPSARAGFAGFFADRIAPELTTAGATLVGSFATEHSPNTFPRLPIREGEHVFVSLARFADAAAHQRTLATLAATSSWRDHVAPALADQLSAPPDVLRLTPTPRSRLPG